jgi:hypothetical protein
MYDTAVGTYTLQNNTTGIGNVALGSDVLYQNTTGSDNTGLGGAALANNTTGTGNVAVGAGTLFHNTTGGLNTALGVSSLADNTTGSQNTALGFSSLSDNTTGTFNTALGVFSLYQNTTGIQNTAIGGYSLNQNTTGTQNTAIGPYSLQTNTGSQNTAIGPYSLSDNTTGTSNIAIGVGSLQYNTTGYNNTASGVGSLQDNTTGGGNTASGVGSLRDNTTGMENTAVGFLSLTDNTTGNYNVAVGGSQLFGGGTLSSNTTGSANTASGYESLQNNTTGSDNTALGYNSLLSNTTGQYNTAIGYNAGDVGGGGLFYTLPNLQDATAIGAFAQVQESNAIVLGSVSNLPLVGIGTTVPLNTFSVSPLAYSVGTASQTSGSNVITGSGTTWTSSMVGGELVFADGSEELITGFTSTTELTGSSTTISESGSAYRIQHMGLQVMSTGNVCVAISSCTNTLGVEGTIAASGTITASATPDISETIPSAPNVQPYDVVSAGPNGKVDAVLSSTPYDPTAIGVISNGTSSFRINANGGSSSTPTGKYLVLAGRVPVYVTNQGGSIAPGDYLTTSSTPGYAMKADHAGPTIGKALGFFNGTSGIVMVQTNLSYYNPSPGNYLQNGDNATFSSLNVSGPTTLSSLSVSGSETVSQNLSVGGEIFANSESILNSLNVSGSASFIGLQISSNGHLITSGNTPKVSALPASGGSSEVSITGNDISGTVTITTGTTPTAGDLVKITFANAYGATPRVLLTPDNSSSATIESYNDLKSTTSFDIASLKIPKASTTYQFDYYVVQ